jgi:hypothetical protein
MTVAVSGFSAQENNLVDAEDVRQPELPFLVKVERLEGIDEQRACRKQISNHPRLPRLGHQGDAR